MVCIETDDGGEAVEAEDKKEKVEVGCTGYA